MDNTITIHNIEQYTQKIINGNLVLTRIFQNPSHTRKQVLKKLRRNNPNPKKTSPKRDTESKWDLEFKVENQEYAQIKNSIDGNNMFCCYCYDGILRNGQNKLEHILHPGDIVLCGLRDFQDGKVDIIHKYTADQVRSLMSYGELPDSVILNETD